MTKIHLKHKYSSESWCPNPKNQVGCKYKKLSFTKTSQEGIEFLLRNHLKMHNKQYPNVLANNICINGSAKIEKLLIHIDKTIPNLEQLALKCLIKLNIQNGLALPIHSHF